MKKKQNFKLTPMLAASCLIALAMIVILVIAVTSVISYNMEVRARNELTPENLVGTWVWDQTPELQFRYTFNLDGTGEYGIENSLQNTTWRIIDNFVEIDITNTRTEQWYIELNNDIMTMTLVGHPYAYAIHHRIID